MLSQEEPTKKAGVAGQARWLKAGLLEDFLRCHIAKYEHVSHVSVLLRSLLDSILSQCIQYTVYLM